MSEEGKTKVKVDGKIGGEGGGREKKMRENKKREREKKRKFIHEQLELVLDGYNARDCFHSRKREKKIKLELEQQKKKKKNNNKKTIMKENT